ncbi:MAG: hypothetical protein IH828_00985 [Nitrospinae bacterium]|nr:hypothetical protein [Nitrospinota bacterium]
MGFQRMLLAVGLLALLLFAPAGAQQSSFPRPPPNTVEDPEILKRMGPLDQVIYRKEVEEDYRKALERQRRLREMEFRDNQRRIVKREILNVHCTWKRTEGKTITKVFKQRVASSCEDAIAELTSDLGGSLSAECTCTGASPTSDTP